MKKPDALTHFRGSEGYNCAQAVLKTYSEHIGLQKSCLEQFSQFGGGCAPNGECGALFAAKAVFSDSETKRVVEDEFVRSAGSKKCREIRKGRIFTCHQCVQTAADVIYTQLNNGSVLTSPVDCAD